MSLRAFILAKDEEANIERGVSALLTGGVEVTVLDSGSTDETRRRAEALGARVEPYAYRDHLTAYRHVCLERLRPGELGLVLDADLVVSEPLLAEVRALADDTGVAVVSAPIAMWWGGAPLRHGSLCPPKPFAVRGGRDPFEATGHAERIRDDVSSALTRAALVHDDRKPFLAYLASQERYAASLVRRARGGRVGWKDRLRVFTPVMLALTPWASYVLRGGFLAGRAGILYALDRLIAEAIMYRQAVASRTARFKSGGSTSLP